MCVCVCACVCNLLDYSWIEVCVADTCRCLSQCSDSFVYFETKDGSEFMTHRDAVVSPGTFPLFSPRVFVSFRPQLEAIVEFEKKLLFFGNKQSIRLYSLF